MVGLTETDSCCQELVTFDEGDPEDPVNWSARKKTSCSRDFMRAFVCVVSLAAILLDVVSPISQGSLVAKYDINLELASSGLSPYFLGFVTVWGH
jgi:hypothetical protein